jgi:sugar phosphate permease
LLAAALSPNLPTLILASYLIGLIGVTPQFIGGALGSAIASAALAHWHWTGVCLAGATLSLIGLLALFTPWPHLRNSGGPTYS